MIRKSAGALLAALLGVTLFAGGAVAQDSTPADCAATTPQENVQIVEDYFDAVMAEDTETADDLLHDDFSHNLSVEGAEVPNEPGNDDELENISEAANVNLEVTHTVAQDDWVAMYYTFDMTGENVEGAEEGSSVSVPVMTMSRIECGMIAESYLEWDSLDLLQQLGFEIMAPGEE